MIVTQLAQAKPQRSVIPSTRVDPRAAISGVDDEEAVRADAYLTDVFGEYSKTQPAMWRYALVHPRLVLRTLGAIRRLSSIDVALPSGSETAAVAGALLENPASRRAMLGVASVLRTPDHAGTFAEGSSKGTLRRKMRAATKLGVTMRPVPAGERAALLALARRHEQENEREEYRNVAPDIDDLVDYDLWIAGYDADDRPITLAVIPSAGEFGVLRYFRTLVAGQASSDARYLMTEAVAEELARRGVRYLVDSARPHWLPNGLRHFQRMVGFRLVRLSSIRVVED